MYYSASNTDAALLYIIQFQRLPYVLLYNLIVCSTSYCHVLHYVTFCITYFINFVKLITQLQLTHKNYKTKNTTTKQIKKLQKKLIFRFCFKFVMAWYASWSTEEASGFNQDKIPTTLVHQFVHCTKQRCL